MISFYIITSIQINISLILYQLPKNCSWFIVFFIGPYYFAFLQTPRASQLVYGLLKPETVISAFCKGVREVTLYQS